MFPVIIAAILKAIDEYGDLLLMAVSNAGNELRLGGYEAPTSVLSVSLGDGLTSYLEKFKGSRS